MSVTKSFLAKLFHYGWDILTLHSDWVMQNLLDFLYFKSYLVIHNIHDTGFPWRTVQDNSPMKWGCCFRQWFVEPLFDLLTWSAVW